MVCFHRPFHKATDDLLNMNEIMVLAKLKEFHIKGRTKASLELERLSETSGILRSLIL